MNRFLACLFIYAVTSVSALSASPIQSDNSINLDSGIFQSVYYNSDRSILSLTFHNGAIYDYYQVSRKTYETFMRTKFKGSFFHAQIRNGYTWQRMDRRQVATLKRHH